MKTTSRGYVYPEPDDYTAGYIQIQQMALEMDADLHTQYALMQGRQTPVGLLATNPSTVTNILPSTATDVTSAMSTVVRNQGWTVTAGFGRPPLPGSYLFGASVNLTCVSANPQTERRLSVVATIPTGIQLGAHRTVSYSSTCMANTTTLSDYLSVQGMFDIDFMPQTVLPPLSLQITHYNATSMTMAAGAFMWCFRVSNGQS